MTLEIGELTRARETSVGATLKIPNTPPQEALVVAERLTQEVIATLKDTTHITDLEYDFFEGWKSKTGEPGFIVYGKDSESRIFPDRMLPVLTVRYRSLDLADTTDIPERFFTGPEPVRPAYLYTVEVSVSSPLEPDPLNPKWDPKKPHGEVIKFLENLATRSDVLSRIMLPGEFYQQFENDLTRAETFPAEVRDELARPDNFTLDGRGRYLVLVHEDPRKGTQFQFGHLRKAFEGHYGGVDMTGSHHLEQDVTLRFTADEISVIYGKGLAPIYTTQKA